VPASIQEPDYAKDGIPRSEQVFVGRNKITILDKAQQEGMRKVCRLAREVLDIAAREAEPGVTTDYIDEIVHKACLERNVSALKPRKNSEKLTQTVLPVTVKLLPFSEVSMHFAQ
jgi:methionyl aminopeptidase